MAFVLVGVVSQGLNDDVPDPFSLEEKNALSLAIVSSGSGSYFVCLFSQ